MPEITATKTAADMTCAKPHTLMPDGGQNRRAARAQAAALRWLVRIAAFLTAAVLVFLIGYILVMGIPNLKPELFAWEYNSENVSLTPALINMGWRGGHFFPVIFSGVSLGYGLAVLTGADPVFCVAVCTASTMGAVMRQPVMVVGLLLMCFPLKGIVCMIIAAVIAAGIPLPKPLRK